MFSSEINNKIRNHNEFKVATLGHFEFKNVDDPVEVFALANEGFIVPKKEQLSGKLKASQTKTSSKKIIAVAIVLILALVAGLVYNKFAKNASTTGKDLTIAVLPFKK